MFLWILLCLGFCSFLNLCSSVAHVFCQTWVVFSCYLHTLLALHSLFLLSFWDFGYVNNTVFVTLTRSLRLCLFFPLFFARYSGWLVSVVLSSSSLIFFLHHIYLAVESIQWVFTFMYCIFQFLNFHLFFFISFLCWLYTFFICFKYVYNCLVKNLYDGCFKILVR